LGGPWVDGGECAFHSCFHVHSDSLHEGLHYASVQVRPNKYIINITKVS
jgi:hypothetical protein